MVHLVFIPNIFRVFRMIQIKTLVYFDIEATGLKSSGKPRISEISFVAVNVQDVLDLHLQILNRLNQAGLNTSVLVEDLLPRILNKLTLCVYPMATIMPVVSTITGLDNYNLTDQARFDKGTVDLLNSFLGRLPAPVCLVAHNGDNYDFPLLKAELEKAGGKFGPEILCADSYIGIKDILKTRTDSSESVKEDIDRELIDKEVEAVTELLASGEFDTEMDTTPRRKRSGENLLNLSKISKLENELTPKRSQSSVVKLNSKPCKLIQVPINSMLKSRKKLKFGSPAKPVSYSLINLHKFLLGRVPQQSHGAEADCLALLRTTAALGKEWVDWVEDNCYVFTDCRRMWGHAGCSHRTENSTNE